MGLVIKAASDPVVAPWLSSLIKGDQRVILLWIGSRYSSFDKVGRVIIRFGTKYLKATGDGEVPHQKGRGDLPHTEVAPFDDGADRRAAPAALRVTTHIRRPVHLTMRKATQILSTIAFIISNIAFLI